MATNQTTNYQLNQWEPTDPVLRTDFNADNAKLDAALKTLENGKAGIEELEALSLSVSGNAAQLSKKGNCQIWTTTYEGTGGSNQNRLTLPAQPLFLCVLNQEGPEIMFLTYGMDWAYSFGEAPVLNQVYWEEGNLLRWCLMDSAGPEGQMNTYGDTYLVFALLKKD